MMCCLAQNNDGSQEDTDATDPLQRLVSQWKVFKKTADCGNAEIVQIVKLIFSMNGAVPEEFKEFPEIFLSFLTDKKVDGKLLLEYEANQFANDIAAFSNNDKFGEMSRGMLIMFKLLTYHVSAQIKESLEWKKVS